MTGYPPGGPVLAGGDPGPSFIAIVDSAARAAAGLVGDAASWWGVPSTSLVQPVVLGTQDVLQPLLLLVLAASVLVQSVRIIVSRKGEPVIAVAGGLVRFAVAAALGVTVLQSALWAGDALAVSLVGDPATGVGPTLRDALTARRDGLAEPFLLLLLSVVVLLLAAAQWMAMALRQVALLAVAATLPLAAAGSLTAATRGWLSRLVPWGLALVLYKPAAALIHAVGAQYLAQLAAGSDSGAATGVSVVLAGIVVLALGVAALPVSLRLLSFTSVRVASGAPGGEAMSGAVGAVRLTGRSSTSPSVQLATYMENAGPGSTLRPATGARLPAGGGLGALPGAHAGADLGLAHPARSTAPGAALDAPDPATGVASAPGSSRPVPALTHPVPRVTDQPRKA